MADERDSRLDRRKLLRDGGRALGLVAAAGALGTVAAAGKREDYVWQIDPDKCIQCGNCATACVLTPSASKAVHDITICGFCDLCFGYFDEQRSGDTETAENVRCPTNAIVRNFVEDPYYEYLIDEPKCIGCASCVEGCQQYGNGSLIMQVRHDRCKNCNECAIAVRCPAQAFVRVPRSEPYLLRSARLKRQEQAEEELGGGAPQQPRPLGEGQPTQAMPQPTQPQLPANGPLEIPTQPAPPMPTRPQPAPPAAGTSVPVPPPQPPPIPSDLMGVDSI